MNDAMGALWMFNGYECMRNLKTPEQSHQGAISNQDRDAYKKLGGQRKSSLVQSHPMAMTLVGVCSSGAFVSVASEMCMGVSSRLALLLGINLDMDGMILESGRPKDRGDTVDVGGESTRDRDGNAASSCEPIEGNADVINARNPLT